MDKPSNSPMHVAPNVIFSGLLPLRTNQGLITLFTESKGSMGT